MTTETPPPWSEAETLDLADAILTADWVRVDAWVSERITDTRLEYTLMSGLAMWCALLVPQFMSAEDGMFVMEDYGATPLALGMRQMLTAACNGDNDALFAHVDALFERPVEERAEVMAQLMKAFHDFGELARRAKAGAA